MPRCKCLNRFKASNFRILVLKLLLCTSNKY